VTRELLAKKTETRLTGWVAIAAFWFFGVFSHGHFMGSDEVAVFEMTRSLAEEGNLSVPEMQHTAIGIDGRRHSFFSPGQSVLALPFYHAGRLAERWLPLDAQRVLRGPPSGYGNYTFGGDLSIAFASLFSTLAGGILMAVFFRFERRLGASRQSALKATALVASSTYVLMLSTYFLRHVAEAACLLGAILFVFRYAHGSGPRDLLAASALASAAFLLRVPAGFAAPVLAGYIGWAIWLRSDGLRRHRDAARAVLCVLLPLALALAAFAFVNQLRWGNPFGSPMVDQWSRLGNPIQIGLRGFLLSPGASLFVYSPLLLLLPFTFPVLWRSWRAEAIAFGALCLSLLLIYSKFDGWEGLWSAPGPRYLFFATPLLLLSLGPWLDQPSSKLRSGTLVVLAALGFFVQLVSTGVHWGSVPALANYEGFETGWEFLFVVDRAPVVEMARLFFSGGPYDPWLIRLGEGWLGVNGRPGLALALFAAWAAGLGALVVAIRRECQRLDSVD
jgi:hypothetical protein